MKQCAKALQKIRKAVNCTYKAKMQKNMQSNTQTIAHDTYENRMQNANLEQAKKYINNLVIASPKKQATTQGKSTTLNINASKQQSSTTTSRILSNMQNIALQQASKPGQRRWQDASKSAPNIAKKLKR